MLYSKIKIMLSCNMLIIDLSCKVYYLVKISEKSTENSANPRQELTDIHIC